MRYPFQKLFFLMAAVCGTPAIADPAPTVLPHSPELSVSIAAPIDRGQHTVVLHSSDPHLDVVVQNVSREPQQIWAENNSMGYADLTLEVFAVDDKTLSVPVVVKRYINVWNSNHVHTVTLDPGEMTVREVNLAKDIASLPHYLDFPSMDGGGHKIRMRAVFTSVCRSMYQPAWSGQVASTPEDYWVCTSSP